METNSFIFSYCPVHFKSCNNPSSIYSWSIGHILEHECFCLGRLGSQGSKRKKVDLKNSDQLFRAVFSTFGEQNFFNFSKNIVGSALKKCIK